MVEAAARYPSANLAPKGIVMFKNKFWTWFARIAAIIGLITGGLALYDYVTTDEYTIEQTVDPEVMKRLRELGPGESITVEKGKPNEPRSSSD